MSDADIIAIGSGHNGQVAAAYLAVAGKRVLVLERYEWFGGGVVTRELDDRPETDDPNAIDKRVVPPGVEVYEINGPFFFGAAYKFEEAMTVVESQPRVRIIRMRDVPAIDSTGLHVLEQVYENCRKQSVALIISEIHAQPLTALDHSGLLGQIGQENVIGTIDGALARAGELLDAPREE